MIFAKHLLNRSKQANQSTNSFALILLAAELVLLSISLFDTVLTWILLLVACATVIRVAIFFGYYKHLPSIRTLNLLAVLSVLGLIYSGLDGGVLLGMVNLLFLACALKLMQVRSRKDVYQLVISLFFLVGCGFIFNQSIGFSLFYALMSLTLLLSLACYHAPTLAIGKQVKTVCKLSAQAAPIGLLLFLVLPQLSPLWHTPRAKGAEAGLSEQITPGDIAALSQSSELAFRASFNTSPPNHRDRYWRAIVLEDFDGKTWQVAQRRKQIRQYQLRTKQDFEPIEFGPYIDYEVIAEPSYQHWLFALDVAKPLNSRSDNAILQSADFSLYKHQPVVSKYQYAVRSYPQGMTSQTLTSTDQRLSLKLPSKGNERTQQWVASLRAQFPQNRDFVAALLAYFTQQPFIYTLRPPVLLTDPIDRFLFDSQAGFCSHYASALAYSLRLGGLPARVVAGYQGGELMQETNGEAYLSIYQYDAHAWVETWDESTGWQRLDPTALVSPDRVDYGLQQAMQEEGSFLADSPFALARMANIAWLNNLRLFLADVDYNWSRWVLGFNSDKQEDLFKTLIGKLTQERLSLLGLSIVGIIVLLLVLFFLPHYRQKRVPKTQRLYLRAVKSFEKSGVIKQNWLGPNDFNQLITERFPDHINQPFSRITQLYLRLLYQAPTQTSAGSLSVKRCQRMMKQQLRILQSQLSKHA